MTQQDKIVGIIGGTGFYDIPGIAWETEKQIETPCGRPSGAYKIGRSGDVTIVFLPRHGSDHSILPSEINHPANIYGMKALGVEWLMTTSAVGSFQEELAPRDIVVVDQFVDRTKNGEQQTFFGHGVIAHIGFAHPVCEELAGHLYSRGKEVTENIHPAGTYLNMQGPAFSTRAESQLYKSWGMDVIGMTSLAEAKLAREAELCYATLAIVTDYDSWQEDLEAVSTTTIIENFNKAVGTAQEVVARSLENFDLPRSCECKDALKDALFTEVRTLEQSQKEQLGVILEKYITNE
ncbi:MAG TPA: MTAP family purine nucleoside phosphorylase [bacterium]|nr:MTAP family purine nucleoside phosphorylase [bacterium]